jgi:hypothetical protein
MAHTLILTVSSSELEVDQLEAVLDKAKDWMRYAPGCWLIHTNHTAESWYGRIADVVAAKGTLVFICEANLEDRSGKLSPTAWKWMKKVRAQSQTAGRKRQAAVVAS